MPVDSSSRLRRKYIHAGVNRIPHIVDWGPGDLVAFGTHNAVAIYDFHVSFFSFSRSSDGG